MERDRDRGSVILLWGDKILMIHRIKDGREYYVFPGGSVEEGETPEEAAVREMKEETNLDIVLEKKLLVHENYFHKQRTVHYYLTTSYVGELSFMNAPEAQYANKDDQYHLEWCSLDELKNLPVVPTDILPLLLEKIFSYAEVTR